MRETGLRARLNKMLPESSTVRLLGLAVLVNTIGTGLYMAVGAIYFTNVVGISADQVALALSIAAFASIFSGVPIGYLADRFGPRSIQISLLVGMALFAAALLWVRSFWAFALLSAAKAVLDRGVGAVGGALIAGAVSGSGRTAARAFSRSMMNLGVSIGAGLSALALRSHGPDAYRVVIGIDALTYLVAGLLYLKLPKVPRSPLAKKARMGVALKDRRYVAVTAAFSLLNIHGAVLSFALPLWITRHTPLPAWVLSGLIVVNTVGVVLLQVPISRRVGSLRSAVRSSWCGGLLLLGSCAFFGFSTSSSRLLSMGVLLLGSLIYLLAELVIFSAQSHLGFALATDELQGQYQGVASTGMALTSTVAPTVMALAPLRFSVDGWIGLGVFFAIVGSLVGPATRLRALSRGRSEPETCRTLLADVIVRRT